ncbi:MAG: AsnC family protein [Actinomycetota bacterium]|nr:AsnC family protein [Actinomycetota bacterium]
MPAGSVQESAVLDRLDRQLIRARQLDPRSAFRHIAAGLEVSEQTVARLGGARPTAC